MKTATRVRLGALVLASALAGLGAAPALAVDARPTADDKCTAQCDEDSDRCMQQAGKDSSKQRQCDSSYDECLRKCQ